LANLGEKTIHPGIRLSWIPRRHLEAVALLVSQGVERSSNFDQVPLVVAIEGVELASDGESQEAEMPRSADFSINERLESFENAGALNKLTSHI
jgi:hypothetical protein